jgi:hypothetical protein
MGIFQPAERKKAKLRLAIDAPSGHGKTFSALLMAFLLGDKVGIGDSEKNSALKYARLPDKPVGPGSWDFLHAPIDARHPNGYVALIDAAGAEGLDVLILDSMSHEWAGAMEKVDMLGGWKGGGKVVSAEHQRVIDSILSFPGHVICTFRAKMAYEWEKNDKGKVEPKKIGIQPEARPGTEYEFDFWLTFQDGLVTVTKSRWGDGLPVGTVYQRTELPTLIEKIKGWLEQGAAQSPKAATLERIRGAGTLDALRAIGASLKALGLQGDAEIIAAFTKRKGELLVAGA